MTASGRAWTTPSASPSRCRTCSTCWNSPRNRSRPVPRWHEGLPASVCVRLTRRCNAACSFCQAPPTSRAEIRAADLGRMARSFARHGVRSMKLSGGEPTVREDLPEIVALIAAAGLKPVVITNGITLSGALLDACAAGGGEFKFSVHRPSSDNDLILRRRSFGHVRKNMARVADRGAGLSVNSVVTPGTLSLMPELVEFSREAGAGKVSFIPVVSRGRARRKNEFCFSSAELDSVIGRAGELAALYRGRIVVRCIDFRSHDYWIVENDGSLWAETASEEADRKICGREDLLMLDDVAVERGL
ncbi:radical SAM protein [Streptomyces xinghaiensis]|uniref:radical SAM protein n=1 Tax=Streptomyces xinghaiensis TaxID=1038928 RepID=UPI002E0E886C|nr:radical SAM protein [Streptomyces xinghaiensis]